MNLQSMPVGTTIETPPQADIYDMVEMAYEKADETGLPVMFIMERIVVVVQTETDPAEIEWSFSDALAQQKWGAVIDKNYYPIAHMEAHETWGNS